MDESELPQVINQLKAARSNEDLNRVLNRYPEVLQAETFQILTEATMNALMMGDKDVAFEIAEIGDLLLTLRDERSPQGKRELQSVPNAEEIETSLTELLRKYCATKSIAVFDQAVLKAKRSGEDEIFSILRAFVRGYSVFATTLLSRYLELYRNSVSREHLLTLLLLKADSVAVTIESFDKTRMIESQMLDMLESGIESATYCLQISAELEDEPCQAYYWHLLGHGFEHKNEYEEAEEYFKRSLILYQKISAEAPRVYEWWTGHIFTCLGVIYFDTKKFPAAEVSFTKSIEYYESSYSFEPDEKKRIDILFSIALMNFNLGNVRIDLGKLSGAELSYRTSLDLNRRISPNPQTDFRVAESLYGLGGAESQLQKKEEAESSYFKALEIYENGLSTLPPREEIALARVYDGLGSVQYDLKKFQAAEENFQRALQILGKYAELQPSFFNARVAAVYFNLGNVSLALEEYKIAESYYSQSMHLHQSLARPDHHSVAMILFNVGVLRGKLEDFAGSIKPLEEAVRLFTYANDVQSHFSMSSISMAKINLGVAKSEMRAFRESAALIREGVAIIEDLARKLPEIYELDAAASYVNIGQMYVRENKKESLELAVEFFERAKKTVEDHLAKVVSPNLKRQIFRQFQNLYYTLLLCYAGLDEWEKALEIAELGKSRSLSDLLALKTLRPKFSLERAPTVGDLSTLENLADEYEDVLKQAHQTENRLVSLYQFLVGITRYAASRESDALSATDEQKRAEIKEQILEFEKIKSQTVSQRDALLEQIRQYDKNFPPESETLNAAQIFEISRESKRVIVLLRVTEKGTYLFAVFPDGTFKPLVVGNFTLERLKVLWNEWFEPYSRFWSGDKYSISTQMAFSKFVGGMKPILETIYAELLKPLHELLKTPEYAQYKEILFVPSIALATLPLHASCWKDEDGVTKYLLDEYAISYSTSVSVFKHAWEIEQKRKKKEKFLFVTNPRNNSREESLRFADGEVDAIMKTFGLTGSESDRHRNLKHDEATRENVEKNMTGDYDFLHFACHGNYILEAPLSSPLSLADGDLTVADIMQIRVRNAWLATLSACETNLADFTQITDDYYGFPLSFVFADCPSIWGSLWSVSDKATSELMEMAYQYLKNSDFKSKPEALRQAQIGYRRKYEKQVVKKGAPDYSSPFFWAGFQNYGV